MDITVQIPPLPEGWSGTPDELLQYFADNLLFQGDGENPSGQVGGTRPTQDVGLWYGTTSIERYIDGKYRPISDVPIGALMPWAATLATMPENYLLCDGRSLSRTDYADLFAVISTTWGNESPTTFNLPDLRGRSPVGAGTGDYKYQNMVGRMEELTAGSYGGVEWITRKTLYTNAPKQSMKDLLGTIDPAKSKYASVQPPMIIMPWIIRHR